MAECIDIVNCDIYLINVNSLEVIIKNMRAYDLMNFIKASKNSHVIDMIYNAIQTLTIDISSDVDNEIVQLFFIKHINKFKNLVMLNCSSCQCFTDEIIMNLTN